VTRIVYGIYSAGGLQGGHKMILRHVEALRDLGFDAVAYTGVNNKIPTWFAHRAPVIVGDVVRPDHDVFVLPDDAFKAMGLLAALPMRTVVMVQNHFNFAARSLQAMQAFPAERFPHLIAVGPTIAGLLGRLYPEAPVSLVRCFADERLFRPAERREPAIAVVPRKRPQEAAAIRHLFGKLHPAHADLAWRELDAVGEGEVAQGFATAGLALSLNQLEGVGMTTLEAMACGALCAGFTGIGGRDYATPDNGYWVDEDDDLAAADALAEAARVLKAGGPELKRRREAGFETARQWSYAAFRAELEACWMTIAPAARLQSGPLD
jgi:hypothetical protein